LQVVRVLLARGAQPERADSSGETAYAKAAERSHSAVMDLLRAAAQSARPAFTAEAEGVVAPEGSAASSAGGRTQPARSAAAAGSGSSSSKHAGRSLTQLLADLSAELERVTVTMPAEEGSKLSGAIGLVAAAQAAESAASSR
jgi:hypothetical protein